MANTTTNLNVNFIVGVPINLVVFSLLVALEQ